MIKDKLYFMEKLDEKKRFRGLDVYFQEEPGQTKTHGYSYLYARRQQEGLGHVMPLDDLTQETKFEQMIRYTIALMGVYNRQNQVVGDMQVRDLYRQCRQGLKTDFNLQKGDVTRLYAMARHRK